MKKQVLCGALAVAAASFVAISAQGTEASAKMDPEYIAIDCVSQTMTLESDATNTGKQYFVGTGKYDAKKKTLKVASWEIYDKDGSVVVDLSKLNKQVENYLVVKDAPTGAPVIIKIAAADKTVAAVYDKGTGTIKVTHTNGTTKNDPYATYGQYRSSASTKWIDVTSNGSGILGAYEDGEWENLDVSMYQRLGATLYYREKTTATSAAGDNTIATYKLRKSEDGDFTYDTETAPKVYNVPAFAGVEKKVTIAALAKGPKITIDYAKHQATFAKGSQYRFVSATETDKMKAIGWNNVTLDAKNKVVAVPIEGDVLTKGGFVESRTAAVDPDPANLKKNPGKLASKVTQTYFNAIGTTAVKNDGKVTTVNETVAIGTDSALTATADSKYTTKKVKVDGESTTVPALKVTLANDSTSDKYEYIIANITPAASDKVGGAIAPKKKAEAKATSKPVTLAVGEKLYVRQPSVNPKGTVLGTWSTNWVEVAAIVEEKPADPTAAPEEE